MPWTTNRREEASWLKDGCVQHPLVLAPDSSLINKICSSDPSKPREKLLFSLSSCSVESICGVCLVFDEYRSLGGDAIKLLACLTPATTSPERSWETNSFLACMGRRASPRNDRAMNFTRVLLARSVWKGKSMVSVLHCMITIINNF